MLAQSPYFLASSPHAAPAGPSSAALGQGAAGAPATRYAVEAVMRIVDAQANQPGGAVAAVNLHFQLGSDQLAVRVEWRDGVVQTQFRTASPELRTAIADEWRVMVSASPDRAQHLAAPVFSSAGSGQGGSASSAGEGDDPQASGQPAWILDPRGPRAPSAAAPPPSAEPDEPEEEAAAAETSLRLHTFA